MIHQERAGKSTTRKSFHSTVDNSKHRHSFEIGFNGTTTSSSSETYDKPFSTEKEEGEVGEVIKALDGLHSWGPLSPRESPGLATVQHADYISLKETYETLDEIPVVGFGREKSPHSFERGLGGAKEFLVSSESCRIPQTVNPRLSSSRNPQKNRKKIPWKFPGRLAKLFHLV